MANIFRAKSLISRTGTFSNEVTAPNLVYNTGNQTISGAKEFAIRPTVNGTGVLLSGEAAALPSTIVYTTGNQTISGNKTFADNLEIQGTGIFSNLDLSNIASFSFSGVIIEFINSVINSSGNIFISGNPVLTGIPDADWASQTELEGLSGAFNNTGINLLNNINSLSGALNSTGINLNNYINNLSGYINSTSSNIVFTTGNQNISGLKDFDQQINVSGIKFDLLAGASIPPDYQDGLMWYDDDNKALKFYNDSITPLTIGQEEIVRGTNDLGFQLNKGQVVYITGAGGDGKFPGFQLSIASGEGGSARTLGIISDNISNNNKGYAISFGRLEGIDTNSYDVGQTLYLSWLNSGAFTGTKPKAPNHLVRVGTVLRKGNAGNGVIFVNIQNGFELDELHDVNINGSYTLNHDDIIRYDSSSGLWFNRPLNTGIFQSQINSLSGAAVLTYGNQTISGTKYFNDAVYANNLYVTGTEFIANVQNNFVQSPYLLLNLTGGAVDGGIFFVTGSGLTGIDDYGPIIGFDHSDKFKFGIGRRGYDISTLNTIASFADIQTYSGFVDNKYATITNLSTTGSNLQGNINTLTTNLGTTGSNLQSNINTVSNNLGTTGSNLQANINTLTTDLANTGSTLDAKVNLLSGSSVLLYGNQLVTGQKTFINNQIFSGNIGVSGTGIFNALDLNNIDNLALSGIDISITGSIVNIYGNILISGNPVLTGIPDGSWASQTELDGLSGAFNLTGSNLSNRIVFVSGALNNSGVNLINQINSMSGAFNLTGSNLSNRIVFVSGALNNSGVNIINSINSMSGAFNITGSNLSDRITSLSGAAVLTYGNQNIGGNKTFTGITTFSGQEVNIIDTALNLSGLGDMTFSSTNINFINSPVLISGTNLRVSGDIFSNNLYTTGNIGVGTNASSEKLEVNGNIKFGDIPNGYSAKFLMYDSPNGVYNTGEWSDGQLILTDAGYATNKSIILNFQGDTNAIESNGSILRLPSGKDDFIAMNAEVVHKTGNEIISGDKIFIDDINVSGTGTFAGLNLENINNLLLSGMIINITGNSILNIFNPVRISGNQVLTGVTQDSRAVLTTTNQGILGIKTFLDTGVFSNLLRANKIYGKDATVDVFFGTPTNAENIVITGGLGSNGGLNADVYIAGGGATNRIYLQNTTNLRGDLNITGGRVYISGNPVLTGIPDGSWASQNELDSLSGIALLKDRNQTHSGDLTVTGHISAASKSFLINHPTQANKKLQYGSLESPYHGIRLTDKSKIDSNFVKINLPDYISSLVNNEKVNIQLTNINHDKILFVKDVNINENNFIVGINRGWFDKNEYEFYWSFTAERKDIPKLTVEF